MPQFNPQTFDVHHFNLRLGMGIGAAIAVLLLILLLKLLLPWLIFIASVGAGLYLWRRHRQHQQRLHACFYDCLQRHDGCISTLEFAMAAHITGPQARAFLDERAKDFFADFEPTAYGDVLYSFRPVAPPTPKAPLPILWGQHRGTRQ